MGIRNDNNTLPMENGPSMIFRFGLILVIGYVCLVVLVFIMQRKMLYFPDREKPKSNQIKALGLDYWPGKGKGYRGFVAIQPDSSISPGLEKTADFRKVRGTIIVFHGNAGAAWHRDYYVNALKPLGYHVLLTEYPGYGGRTGSPSETSFIKDAHQTIRLAHEAFGGPLYLWGESLGCGIVAAVADSSPVPVDGICLITPWDSLPDLAQSIYWYFPVRLLIKDRYDNVANLASYQGPVAIVMATLDNIIPNKRTLRLYKQIKSPKRLWRFKDAGHNDWPTEHNAKWWREVMMFIASNGQE